TDVALIESLIASQDLKAEERRQLDGQGGGNGEPEHNQGLGACGYFGFIGGTRSHDQLLPQPLGVLARKLARQRIETAHALDRDEEGLIGVQACCCERRHLIAEVILQLIAVARMKRWAT